nr:orf R7 [Mycoplasma capricolum subsp. capricolum ATCC 27343]
MSFAIVVNRGHWVSDITFTYLWLLPLIFLTHFFNSFFKFKDIGCKKY